LTKKSKDNKVREMVEIKKNDQMWLLKKMLGIKSNTCYYCKKELKEGDTISIFNKPTRVLCDSILCMAECVGDSEDETWE